MKVTFDELQSRYERDMTTRFVCKCEFATPLAGGLSADENGVRLFVRHQLKIADTAEVEKAVRRIMTEEIGDRPVPSADGS